MNTKHCVKAFAALCLLTAGGSTFAVDDYVTPAAGFMSSMSRSDVNSELRDAKANGSAASSRIDGDVNSGAGAGASMVSRGEVKDALIAQRRDHAGNAPSSPKDIYYGN